MKHFWSVRTWDAAGKVVEDMLERGDGWHGLEMLKRQAVKVAAASSTPVRFPADVVAAINPGGVIMGYCFASYCVRVNGEWLQVSLHPLM